MMIFCLMYLSLASVLSGLYTTSLDTVHNNRGTLNQFSQGGVRTYSNGANEINGKIRLLKRKDTLIQDYLSQFEQM